MSYLTETTIGKLCRQGGGSVQTGPFGSQLKASAYVERGIPVVMPADLIDYRIDETNIARIGPSDHQRLSRHHLRPGDIVYGRRGDIGRHARVAERENGWLCGTGCLRIRFGDAPVDSRYVSYYLRQKRVIELILGKAVGTTMPNLNTDILSSIPISLPPLPTQRRIAEILGHLDDKIELNRRLNRKLEEMAQALYKHHFVDFGPYQGGEFVESELGVIPKGWRVGTLGEVISIYDSLRIPLSNIERAKRQGPYPYYGATSIMDYVDDFIFDGTYTLIGEDGSVIKPDDTPFVQYVFGQFWVNNHAHVLQGKGSVSTEHVRVFLEQANVRPFVTGAVQAKISQANLKKIPFIIAPDEINRSFDAHLQPWFAQMRHNEVENRKLAEIRDYLLPKLLGGEIAVS